MCSLWTSRIGLRYLLDSLNSLLFHDVETSPSRNKAHKCPVVFQVNSLARYFLIWFQWVIHSHLDWNLNSFLVECTENESKKRGIRHWHGKTSNSCVLLLLYFQRRCLRLALSLLFIQQTRWVQHSSQPQRTPRNPEQKQHWRNIRQPLWLVQKANLRISDILCLKAKRDGAFALYSLKKSNQRLWRGTRPITFWFTTPHVENKAVHS